jgi:peptidoglycan LD-endopeptidase CwlK
MADLATLLQRAEPKLANLNPIVAQKARKLIASAYNKGIKIIITQGYRSIEEQNRLYEQGRSKPGKKVTNAKGGQSYHNFGLAFDIAVLNEKGAADYSNISAYKAVGQLGKELDLEWGGDWTSLKDYPHFQDTFGLSLAELRAGKRPAQKPPSNTGGIIIDKPSYLKQGDQGPDVKSIQTKLLDLGYKLNGGADGIYGPSTAEAVRQFQKNSGLSADGIASPATLAKLDQEVKKLAEKSSYEQELDQAVA